MNLYRISSFLFLFFLTSAIACGQTTNDPFPNPIETEEGLVIVDVVEFAYVPDSNGDAARMMLLVDEPETERLFVNDMRGPLHSVSYDGREVTLYVNINDPRWGVGVEYSGRERGFQSFAFHPEFGQPGSPGYGRFYTWSDVEDNQTPPTFDRMAEAIHTIPYYMNGEQSIPQQLPMMVMLRGN
jgi:hypothetical protein